MPFLRYQNYNPQRDARILINLANEILEEFESLGYKLTLRQLYYQMVSKDVIPNNQRSYDKLGSIISRARDAGMIDWDHIEDRTRIVRSHPHWDDGADFMRNVVPQFRLDLWKGQETRVMVFVEKQALEQVVGRPSMKWDIPYFANKGYLSSSAAWNVARNMMLLNDDSCNDWVILHLGDHDPSGIDMSRDIEERLNSYSRLSQEDIDNGFSQIEIEVRRIALNMDQVREYEPPPNPAKRVDPRFGEYQDKFGDESWELDALRPSVITSLIDDQVESIVDYDLWEEHRVLQGQIRTQLLEDAGIEEED